MKKANMPFTFLVSLLILFISCKKDNHPEAGGERLYKIEGSGGDSTGTTLFNYDLAGHLSSAEETINNVPVSMLQYTYNANGTLEKSEFKDLLSGGTWNDVYSYQNDKIVRKVSTGDNGIPTTTVYVYNAQGKLVGDTTYDDQMLPYHYSGFSYDIRGNLSQWQGFLKIGSAPNWVSSGVNTALYRSNPNPFYDLGLIYYISKGDLRGLSPYSIHSLNTTFGIDQEYTYSYYSNGLPSQVLINSGYPPNVTVKFYYN